MRSYIGAHARGEARDARDWYRDRDPSTVPRFRRRMSEAVRLIELFPESGAPHALDTRRLRLSPFPYSLVYRVIGDRIEIIAVAHDRQQSGYWRSR